MGAEPVATGAEAAAEAIVAAEAGAPALAVPVIARAVEEPPAADAEALATSRGVPHDVDGCRERTGRRVDRLDGALDNGLREETAEPIVVACLLRRRALSDQRSKRQCNDGYNRNQLPFHELSPNGFTARLLFS